MLPRCGEVDLADQEKRCYGPAGFGFDCRRAEEFEYGEKMVESRNFLLESAEVVVFDARRAGYPC